MEKGSLKNQTTKLAASQLKVGKKNIPSEEPSSAPKREPVGDVGEYMVEVSTAGNLLVMPGIKLESCDKGSATAAMG